MRPTLQIAASLTLAVVALPAPAQEPGGSEPVYVPAELVERVSPDYPRAELQRRKEGWVMVSFVILPTGEVSEAMVEASSGGQLFERAALRAVERWKYRPATEDGVPVAQAMTRTYIRFHLGEPEGASKAFGLNYRRLLRLIEEQDFAAAGALLADMEAGDALNRFETAWFWWAKYIYLSSSGSTDVAEMRRALERAVGFEDVHLSPDQFVAAAERLVILQAQAADIASAMATFERLRDTPKARLSRNHEQSVANLQSTYDTMLELVNGDKVLVMDGTVGEWNYWVHDLLRRSFSIADVTGRVDALDIRCARGTRRYGAVTAGTVWRVPNSWGKCGIYLKGEPGTTFAFREYPRGYESASTVDVGAQ